MSPRVSFEGAKFGSIFGLSAIIFAADMLESIKGSIDAYFDLVFN